MRTKTRHKRPTRRTCLEFIELEEVHSTNNFHSINSSLRNPIGRSSHNDTYIDRATFSFIRTTSVARSVTFSKEMTDCEEKK